MNKEYTIKIKKTYECKDRVRYDGSLGPGKRIVIEQSPFKLPYKGPMTMTQVHGITDIGTVSHAWAHIKDLTKITIQLVDGYVSLFYEDDLLACNYYSYRKHENYLLKVEHDKD